MCEWAASVDRTLSRGVCALVRVFVLVLGSPAGSEPH